MPRKEKPIYEKIETSGDFKELNNKEQFFGNSYGTTNNSQKINSMSVYTDFIPLLYLTSGLKRATKTTSLQAYLNLKQKNDFKDDEYNKWIQKYDGGTLSGFCKYSFTSDQESNIINLKESIESWMEYDRMMDVETILGYPRYSWEGINRTTIMQQIRTGHIGSSCQRTYIVGTSAFSMYRGEDNRYIPHVLAVILPENYLYLKYKLLTQNVLDLSKVIILVDRELNTAKFCQQAFRKLYKEAMLPQIMKSSCDVWKVPQSFIQEKCFVEPFNLRGIKLKERGEFLGQLVKEFTSSFSKAPVSDACLESNVENLEQNVNTNQLRQGFLNSSHNMFDMPTSVEYEYEVTSDGGVID